MNENQDWERRLQELEIEIEENPSSSSPPAIEAEIVEETDSIDKSQQIEKAIAAIADWFNSLPTPAKIAVAVGGVLVGLSILNTLLHLVSSATECSCLSSFALCFIQFIYFSPLFP